MDAGKQYIIKQAKSGINRPELSFRLHHITPPVGDLKSLDTRAWRLVQESLCHMPYGSIRYVFSTRMYELELNLSEVHFRGAPDFKSGRISWILLIRHSLGFHYKSGRIYQILNKETLNFFKCFYVSQKIMAEYRIIL